MSQSVLSASARCVRAAVLIPLVLSLCAGALRAQLPAGEYLLNDPVRGILGVALAYEGSYGSKLDVGWIGPLGNYQSMSLWWNGVDGVYATEEYVTYRFFTFVLNGVPSYRFERESVFGGWQVISAGTIG